MYVAIRDAGPYRCHYQRGSQPPDSALQGAASNSTRRACGEKNALKPERRSAAAAKCDIPGSATRTALSALVSGSVDTAGILAEAPSLYGHFLHGPSPPRICS